eukprot:gene2762-3436_t
MVSTKKGSKKDTSSANHDQHPQQIPHSPVATSPNDVPMLDDHSTSATKITGVKRNRSTSSNHLNLSTTDVSSPSTTTTTTTTKKRGRTNSISKKSTSAQNISSSPSPTPSPSPSSTTSTTTAALLNSLEQSNKKRQTLICELMFLDKDDSSLTDFDPSSTSIQQLEKYCSQKQIPIYTCKEYNNNNFINQVPPPSEIPLSPPTSSTTSTTTTTSTSSSSSTITTPQKQQIEQPQKKIPTTSSNIKVTNTESYDKTPIPFSLNDNQHIQSSSSPSSSLSPSQNLIKTSTHTESTSLSPSSTDQQQPLKKQKTEPLQQQQNTTPLSPLSPSKMATSISSPQSNSSLLTDSLQPHKQQPPVINKSIPQPIPIPTILAPSVFHAIPPMNQDSIKKAHEDAQTMRRIHELQKQGIWGHKQLHKLPEPPRPKVHWDHLLEEMALMSEDFIRFKKYKSRVQKVLCREVNRHHLLIQSQEELNDREEETNKKHLAESISKEIKNYWSQINKLVQYKDNNNDVEMISSTTTKTEEDNGNQQEEDFDLLQKESEIPLSELLKDIKKVHQEHSADNCKDILKLALERSNLVPSIKQLKSHMVPDIIKFPLREYQQIGFDWLVSLYNKKVNGILADDSGLGKTIMTISLIAYLAVECGVWGPHLIIVPQRFLLNWELEFKKWCPGLKILTYSGSQKERKMKRNGWMNPNQFHVCLTTYSVALSDQLLFRRRKWSYVVLDEYSCIKNFSYQRWKTFIGFNSDFRLVLSSTSIQNNYNPVELWSLLHFIIPEILNSCRDQFLIPPDNLTESTGGSNQELIPKLQSTLGHFQLRRNKKDVEQQLPTQNHHIIPCQLSSRQQTLHQEYINSSTTINTLENGSFFSIVNILLHLRQICDHPDLIEVRPIASSLDLKPISYQVHPHIVNILQDQPIKTIDLNLLNLDLLGNEKRGLSKSDIKMINHLKPTTQSIMDLLTSTTNTTTTMAPITVSSTSSSTTLSSSSTTNTTTPKNIHLSGSTSGTSSSSLQHSTSGIPTIGLGSSSTNTPTAASQPVFCMDIFQNIRQEISQQRLQDTLSRAILHQSRFQNQPIYGDELIKCLESMGIDPVGKIHITAANNRNYLEVSEYLQSLVILPEDRANKMSSIIDHFVFLVPKVRAPKIEMIGESLNPILQPMQSINTLSEAFEPFYQSFQQQKLNLPDKRLLQYDCGKLQKLALILNQLNPKENRVVIFTQFTKMLDILEQFLYSHGYSFQRLDGSTPLEKRKMATQRFNSDPKTFVYILSTRCGDLGVNITSADTVIFYDQDWNPTMNAQTIDKCNGIGKIRNLNIYRLINENTIEDLKNDDSSGNIINNNFFDKIENYTLFKLNPKIESNIKNISQQDWVSALDTVEDESDILALRNAEKDISNEFPSEIGDEISKNVPISEEQTQNIIVDYLNPIQRYSLNYCKSLPTFTYDDALVPKISNPSPINKSLSPLSFINKDTVMNDNTNTIDQQIVPNNVDSLYNNLESFIVNDGEDLSIQPSSISSIANLQDNDYNYHMVENDDPPLYDKDMLFFEVKGIKSDEFQSSLLMFGEFLQTMPDPDVEQWYLPPIQEPLPDNLFEQVLKDQDEYYHQHYHYLYPPSPPTISFESFAKPMRSRIKRGNIIKQTAQQFVYSKHFTKEKEKEKRLLIKKKKEMDKREKLRQEEERKQREKKESKLKQKEKVSSKMSAAEKKKLRSQLELSSGSVGNKKKSMVPDDIIITGGSGTDRSDAEFEELAGDLEESLLKHMPSTPSSRSTKKDDQLYSGGESQDEISVTDLSASTDNTKQKKTRTPKTGLFGSNRVPKKQSRSNKGSITGSSTNSNPSTDEMDITNVQPVIEVIPWCNIEDNLIIESVKTFGQNWDLISHILQTSLYAQIQNIKRTKAQCADRYKTVLFPKEAESKKPNTSSQQDNFTSFEGPFPFTLFDTVKKAMSQGKLTGLRGTAIKVENKVQTHVSHNPHLINTPFSPKDANEKAWNATTKYFRERKQLQQQQQQQQQQQLQQQQNPQQPQIPPQQPQQTQPQAGQQQTNMAVQQPTNAGGNLTPTVRPPYNPQQGQPQTQPMLGQPNQIQIQMAPNRGVSIPLPTLPMAKPVSNQPQQMMINNQPMGINLLQPGQLNMMGGMNINMNLPGGTIPLAGIPVGGNLLTPTNMQPGFVPQQIPPQPQQLQQQPPPQMQPQPQQTQPQQTPQPQQPSTTTTSKRKDQENPAAPTKPASKRSKREPKKKKSSTSESKNSTTSTSTTPTTTTTSSPPVVTQPSIQTQIQTTLSQQPN